MTGQLTRPTTVVWAFALSAINGVAGVIFTATWPDLEDRGTVLPVSVVIAALLIASAWALSNGNRWGAIVALVLNAFNILLAIPGYFNSDVGLIVGGTVTIVLSVLTLGLVLSAPARTFWGGASRIE